jgi:Peptidase A4 family
VTDLPKPTAAKVPCLLGSLSLAFLSALIAILSGAPMASATTAVSSNWAGYVAAPSAAVGSHFSSVSGSWVAPSATCLRGTESYSAIWVGLGGASEGSKALEQVGTDADCSRLGKPVYSAWFELLPAEAVDVQLAVHPGDRLTASATVRAHDATLRLRDLTTGARFTTTRRTPHIDVSSADWIVEAPSVCTVPGPCRAFALTDFGSVAFSSASATGGGHTGPIEDPDWAATALELRQGPHQAGHRGTVAVGDPADGLIVAAPSAASGPEGAFGVRWQEQVVQGERTASG